MLTTKQDIKQFQQELHHVQINLDTYTEDYFNQHIQKYWEILKRIQAKEDLKSMPINVLMVHGLRTIYDVRDHDIYDLMDINGVGRISAEAIVEAVAKLRHLCMSKRLPV